MHNLQTNGGYFLGSTVVIIKFSGAVQRIYQSTRNIIKHNNITLHPTHMFLFVLQVFELV